MSRRVLSEMARNARGVVLKRRTIEKKSHIQPITVLECHGTEYGSYQIATPKNLSDNADSPQGQEASRVQTAINRPSIYI